MPIVDTEMRDSTNSRLDSWKAIAAYLHRDERTAQRWVRERGLPVHRIPGGRRNAVFAYVAEVDAWLSTAPRISMQRADAEGSHVPTNRVIPAPSGQMLPVPPTSPRPSHASVPLSAIAVAGILLIIVLGFALHQSLPSIIITRSRQITDDGWDKQQLAADSSRIYFSEAFGAHRVLRVISSEGGDSVSVPVSLAEPAPIDIARSGNEIILAERSRFGMQAALWAVALPGGSPRFLHSADYTTAAWSPDGSTLAYSDGGKLFIGNADGRNARELARLPERIGQVLWRPDGRLLRFSCVNPLANSAAIWQIRPDGNGLEMILSSQGERDSLFPRLGGWSEDGRYFFFISTRAGGHDIWALHEQRSGLSWLSRPQRIRLTSGPVDFDNLAVSRSGNQLFATGLDPRQNELYLYNGAKHQFEPYLRHFAAADVQFSSDGDWMVFGSHPDETLWRSRPDGVGRVQLTFAPMAAELSRWSPDGSQIAFTAHMPGRPWKIYSIPSEGGDPTELIPEDSLPEGAPSWAPDGQSIVFGRIDCEMSAACAIFSFDLRSRRLSKIPGSEGLRTARLSPHGSYIAAIAAHEQELRLFDSSTRHWRTIATGLTGDSLDWDRAGNYVYYINPRNPGSGVYRIRILPSVASRTEFVADFSALPGSLDPAEAWGGLTFDGAILISVRSPREIYSVDWAER